MLRSDVAEPRSDQVIVRVEAAPINPSDLGLLFGMADMSTATVSGTPERPVVTARVPPNLMRNLSARVDQSMPVGNEGAGIVVDAGSDDEAQALMGKTVAMLGGGDVLAVSLHQSEPVFGVAGGDDACGWRVVFCQSAHRAGYS